MAQPVANTPSVRSTTVGYTVGGGLVAPNSNTTLTTANVPFDNQTVLLGIDAVQYTVPPGGKINILFPNLPVFNNANNPLNTVLTGQKPFTVLPQDTLVLMTVSQSTNYAVAVEGYGLLSSNVKAPGPFLGSGTYLGFGTTVSGNTGSTGIIVGMLMLRRGTQ